MENLAAFLAATCGTAFTYELVLLIVFVLLLNIRRAIWSPMDEPVHARVTEPVRVVIVSRARQ